MSIHPLPVFEADVDPHNRSAMTDAERYEQLEPPKTMVVRFGSMKMIGEFKYGGDAKPGCGTKVVARTQRGTELAEMLTTTCENAGCGKSVTRQEMLDYIEQSGGREFPFYTNGRVIRIATIEDMNDQAALRSEQSRQLRFCRALVEEMGLKMKVVDAEPILGGELLTFYFMVDDRVDFRELVEKLAREFGTRIEMQQVGARDEARLQADYEKCGQYCCCKSFLKVLKPISMRAAKMQKATLDPVKISGRCGRLMCCLRYEDQSYRELKAALPNRKKRVGTSEGPGIVLDGKILVQLVLVKLEHDGREIAVPVEELMDPDECPKPGEAPMIEVKGGDPLRGLSAKEVEKRVEGDKSEKQRGRGRRRKARGERKGAEGRSPGGSSGGKDAGEVVTEGEGGAGGGSDRPKSRRRSRGGRGRKRAGAVVESSVDQGKSGGEKGGDGGGETSGGKKGSRRRRRGGRGRKRGGGGGGEGSSGPSEG